VPSDDQTYPNRELVIVSDGHLRYRRALEHYIAHLALDSVRFVYPEAKQLPLSQLWNISLDAADGDLICQWDDDDCYHPERLAVQLAHILDCNARGCCFTDHLQLLEADRELVWVDWTLGGRSGEGQLLPGTIMAFRDRPFRYPETGPYVNRGEDSVFLDDLYRNVPIAPLSGMGHMYLYTYHGGNTFSKEHHYNLRVFSASRSELNEKIERIRQAIAYCQGTNWPRARSSGTVFRISSLISDSNLCSPRNRRRRSYMASPRSSGTAGSRENPLSEY